MRSPLSLAVASALATFAASSLAAQTVHVVDVGGGTGADFTQIQDAVDAAGEGDTILVKSGTYEPVLVSGKSLVIEADAGAFVHLLPDFSNPGAAPLRIEELGATQSVAVRGVDARASFLGAADALIELENNQGSVWLEDCTILPSGLSIPLPQPGLSAVSCAGVTLTRCVILGSVLNNCGNCPQQPGLAATASNLNLWETTVTGVLGSHPGGFSLPQPGGPGVLIDGGSLYAAGCTIIGGTGAGGFLGQDGADGGDGLVLVANEPLVRLLDTTLEGGAGGSGNGVGTSAGDDGAHSTVLSGTLATISGDARSFATASPIRAGVEALAETFSGQPGDVVVLAYSLTGPFQGAFLGAAKGNLVIAPPLVLIAKGTIDDSGTLVTQPPTAALPAGVDTQPVFLQGAMLSATGQGVFLSSPSVLSLLAAGF